MRGGESEAGAEPDVGKEGDRADGAEGGGEARRRAEGGEARRRAGEEWRVGGRIAGGRLGFWKLERQNKSWVGGGGTELELYLVDWGVGWACEPSA